MEPLLYLTHRIPYPPNKGDKLTTFHILRHLSGRYRVHLGTFVDDPADRQHIGAVRRMCADAHFAELNRGSATLRSLRGLLVGDALNVPYYRDRGLDKWVRQTIESHGIAKAVVYAAPMAQYVIDHSRLTRVIQFADVDSQKWIHYGEVRRWPLSMVYRREGGRLLAFERRAAAAFDTSFFVTPAEAQLFRGLAPESAAKVSVLANGVDAEYFSPDPTRESPYPPDRRAIVFTGAMNYWPNVEAVTWFAREMLPRIRAVVPDAWFYVVGMSPAPAVQRLTESAGIVVTGTVRDVRPYLQHAGVVVAPLRLARGIQNKILEAMAMEKAVVASVQCAESLSAVPHLELEIADTADSFVQSVTSLLADDRAAAIGAAARRRVLLDYDWDRNLAAIDEALSPSAQFAGGRGDPIMPHPRTFASFGATERSGAA